MIQKVAKKIGTMWAWLQIRRRAGFIGVVHIFSAYRSKGLISLLMGIYMFFCYKYPFGFMIYHISKTMPVFQLICYIVYPLISCSLAFIVFNLISTKGEFTLKSFLITFIFSFFLILLNFYLIAGIFFIIPEIYEYLTYFLKKSIKIFFPVIYADSLDSSTSSSLPSSRRSSVVVDSRPDTPDLGPEGNPSLNPANLPNTPLRPSEVFPEYFRNNNDGTDVFMCLDTVITSIIRARFNLVSVLRPIEDGYSIMFPFN